MNSQAQPFDENTLVDRLRGQDHEAFNLLVQHFHLRLVKFSAGIVGQSLAEEVVQEAWISVFRALPKFEGKSSLKTWLYTIVRNESLGRFKKEKRQPEAMVVSDDAQDPVDAWFASSFAEDGHWNHELTQWHITTPEGLLQEQQLKDCIEKNMARLRADQKAVFELRELEHLPMEEVCNILDVSHSNARVLLHRARLRLLQVVNKYQETGEC